MNPIQTVRTVSSFVIGCVGGPVGGIVGTGVKSLTPSELSLPAKTAIGLGASALAAGSTYVLTSGSIDAGSFAIHLRFLGGAVSDWGSAGIAAFATGVSYAVGCPWTIGPARKKTSETAPTFRHYP